MYFTGFADEAAKDLAGQIKATKELGWTNIESRAIDGVNIHDLPQDQFDRAADALDAAGIKINCFGSAIANPPSPTGARKSRSRSIRPSRKRNAPFRV